MLCYYGISSRNKFSVDVIVSARTARFWPLNSQLLTPLPLFLIIWISGFGSLRTSHFASSILAGLLCYKHKFAIGKYATLITMKFTPTLLALAVSTSKSVPFSTRTCSLEWDEWLILTVRRLLLMTATVSAQAGLFERSLDSHIRTICGIDFVSPTPSPTRSPSSAPSLSPSVTPAPTILEKACDIQVGRGECLDENGRGFDYCHSNPLALTARECQVLAESLDKSVGWQFGPLGVTLFICTIYFDNADSGNNVLPLCPDGFSGLSTRSGTGFPVSYGRGYSMCFSCNK